LAYVLILRSNHEPRSEHQLSEDRGCNETSANCQMPMCRMCKNHSNLTIFARILSTCVVSFFFLNVLFLTAATNASNAQLMHPTRTTSDAQICVCVGLFTALLQNKSATNNCHCCTVVIRIDRAILLNRPPFEMFKYNYTIYIILTMLTPAIAYNPLSIVFANSTDGFALK